MVHAAEVDSAAHVELATYPIPPQMSRRLEAAVACNSGSKDAVSAVKLDSVSEAVGSLISNCIVALDGMYFSSPPKARRHPAFQHRLCIRIAADVSRQRLTVTDLGIGMTRSDLINCLGVGGHRKLDDDEGCGDARRLASSLHKALGEGGDGVEGGEGGEEVEGGEGGDGRDIEFDVGDDDDITGETSLDDEDDDDDDFDEDIDDIDNQDDQDDQDEIDNQDDQDEVDPMDSTDDLEDEHDDQEDDHDVREDPADDGVTADHVNTVQNVNVVDSVHTFNAGDNEQEPKPQDRRRCNPNTRCANNSASATLDDAKYSSGALRSASANSAPLSCTAHTLGGFYAAFCALGNAITVRTKSRFDDYYEFQVGEVGVDPDTDPASHTNDGQNHKNLSNNSHNCGHYKTDGIDGNYDTPMEDPNAGASPLKQTRRTVARPSLTSFQIRRIQPEGTQLSAANGQSRFEDIRGDSGTSVTIHLNAAAVQAGLLNEQGVLKPMLLKIVEQTQYTVAFSSDAEQARAIIDASAAEAAAKAQGCFLEDDSFVDEDDDIKLTTETKDEPVNTVDTDMGASSTTTSQHDHNNHHDHHNHHHKQQNNSVKERAKYIPIRLSLGERKMLRLVEATMTCCDYTTFVDRPFPGTSVTASAARRTHEQLRSVSAVLHGLVTACDYSAGQKLLQTKNFAEYATFFQQMFEIARRHKIMNPEKMRTDYGKLVYLLQDALSPTLQQHLGFSVQLPISTVYRFLEKRNGLGLLDDPLIERATEEILAGPGRSRSVIDNEIRLKERAVQLLKKRYKTAHLSPDDIHLCLYSICDNNSFLNSNRLPIDKVIHYLTSNFSPHSIQNGYSLSIVSGTDGARLSHSHKRQYYFALQSLTLWRTIVNDMFQLWATAEEDLLSTESVMYSLQNTGQGMQRVQQSPRTYKAMQQILARVQNKVQHWVGSSVIHMGDHNVPNALSFIDKYTQVPRILGPIVTCLEVLEQFYLKDEGIAKIIDSDFKGLDTLRKDILYDFFKSAFDGSGADNFYDAGSCIDGRLTSAWNWCSQLPHKPFYPIFKLTGFIGFDGEFQ